jgi:hypothetical protein
LMDSVVASVAVVPPAQSEYLSSYKDNSRNTKQMAHMIHGRSGRGIRRNHNI